MAIIIHFLAKWIIDNKLYISSITIALIADLIVGIIVHLFYFKDFDSKKMILKCFKKLFCTTIGLILFELFGILFLQYDVEMGAYLKLSIALTVLSYPALSAFGNLSVITKGKFPPIGWIERLTKFNNSGNIKDIIDKDENNSPYEDL